MGPLPDSLLLEHLKRGEAVALETLFERYEPTLFPFLLGLLRDHQLAEDALQETFIKTLTSIDSVNPERFRGWLFTVGYREAMQLRRRGKRVRTAESDRLQELIDPLPDGADQAARGDEHRRLRELLQLLPPVQRDVIVARIFHGKRFKEIANELGCPLNTALARMHEGLKKLRVLWEVGHE